MKLFTEYLSTNISNNKKFPDKPTVKNIVKWLSANNFTKYNIVGKYDENDDTHNDAISTNKFFQKFDDARFYVARETQKGPWEQTYAITFCVGKPNEKNPAITMFASNKGIKVIADKIAYTRNHVLAYDYIKTIDELKEILHTYFEKSLDI